MCVFSEKKTRIENKGKLQGTWEDAFCLLLKKSFLNGEDYCPLTHNVPHYNCVWHQSNVPHRKCVLIINNSHNIHNRWGKNKAPKRQKEKSNELPHEVHIDTLTYCNKLLPLTEDTSHLPTGGEPLVSSNWAQACHHHQLEVTYYII